MWSPGQETALKTISRWLRDSDSRELFLFGYAGTGKTTLAKELQLLTAGRVMYSSYTGKAVNVLLKKGCTPARTLHSLLYTPRGESSETLQIRLLEMKEEQEKCDPDSPSHEELGMLIRDLQYRLENPTFAFNPTEEISNIDVLVVDECSMIDDILLKDLRDLGKKILFMGDPGQLPPVKGNGNLIKRQPDILLEDIHRQMSDSPILYMASLVRSGGKLMKGTYGECRVVGDKDNLGDLPTTVNQILCGRRKTRDSINRRSRELRGYKHSLETGDRVMCLRNDMRNGLFNGQIWLMVDIPQNDWDPQIWNAYAQQEDTLDYPRWLDIGFNPDFPRWDYAYGLTVHKSQGSQWKNILLFDESYAFRGIRNKWLYTAITRAEEVITIVQ